MNRILAGLGLLPIFTAGVLHAQDASSLEKTYAALCGNQADQHGETCVALREAIANKPGVTPKSDAEGQRAGTGVAIADWGVLGRLAGTNWIAGPHPDGTVTIHKYVLTENGTAIEFNAYTPGLPMGLKIVFRKGNTPGVLQGEVHELGDAKGIAVPFHVEADSVRSDWYRIATTFGMGGVNLKRDMALSKEGTYLFLQGYGKGAARPAPVNGFPNGFVQYAAQDVTKIEAQGQVAGEAAMAQAYRDLAEEKRQRQRERSARFDAAMESLQGVLSTANEVAQANESRSRVELERTLNTRTPSGGRPVVAGASGSSTAFDATQHVDRSDAQLPVPPVAAGSLRFVLDIGMASKPGDTVNPTCYSNMLTRPGPAGWGQGGSLPPGSEGEARSTVESLKSRFIAACEAASGRTVTSEGDFHWTWNEFRDGESAVTNVRARHQEDVTVDP